jgi:hypothetical protein
MAPAPVSTPVSAPVSTPVSALRPMVSLRVTRFQIDGKSYLRSSDNILYDAVTRDEVGIWDPETRTIMPFSDDDDSDYNDDADDDDDDEEEQEEQEEPENKEVSFRP